MTRPILKSLLGHSSLTTAYVAVDKDGNIILVNEDGSTSAALGVGISGRLANQLRDETGTDNEIRFLRGFSTAGDGGEGSFRWTNTPGYDDGGVRLNDGGLHSLSAGWERIVEGDSIKVSWFGAVGDCREGVASANIGSPNITIVSGAITAADIGKIFAIDFADGADHTLVGTILNVVGTTVTLNVNAGATVTNKFARWGTNDADALQRAFNYAQSKISSDLTYSGPEVRLQGSKRYLVHRTGGIACLEVGSNVKLSADSHSALVGASDNDIIIRSAMSFTDFENIQFRYGKHAVIMWGESKLLSRLNGVIFGGTMGSAASSQSVCRFMRCQFYQQRGPSIYQDLSYGWSGGIPPAGNPTNEAFNGANHVEIRDFEFFGSTLWHGLSNGLTISGGWIVMDNTYASKWDDGREMGWVVQSASMGCYDCSAAPFVSSTAPWFEGNGHFVTKNFRMGGEGARPGFALRKDTTSALVYGSYPLAVDPISSGTCVYSDTDAWSSILAGVNLIECYDEMPSVISIRRPETASAVSSRAQLPFPNLDASIYIDSSTISEAEMYAQAQPATELNLWDVNVPIRFVAAAAVGHLPPAFDVGPYNNYQYGKDVTHLIREYAQQDNSPACVEARANLWWSDTTNQTFDPSYGPSSLFSGVALNNVGFNGTTIRQVTCTNDNNDGNAVYFLDRQGTAAKWGSGLPAGMYTISIYVLADYAGSVIFAHDASIGFTGTRQFDKSNGWQRLSWSFYYNGTNDKSLIFTVPSIPGDTPGVTPGVGGSVLLAFPMINAGTELSPYTIPGMTTSAGPTSGDVAQFGPASDFGRRLAGYALHTAGSSSAETAGNIVLSRDGTYVLSAEVLARKGDGTAHLAGVRRAVFKRESGTTAQLGTTETIGSDQFDAGAAAYLMTIDNTSSTLRFRTTGDTNSIWQINWNLSLKVTS